jgi:hypothetical protein
MLHGVQAGNHHRNPVLNVILKRFIVSVFSVVPDDGCAPMGEWNS